MPEPDAQPMTKRVPALLARTQFGQILDRAGGNRERFVVTKKGQAKVIILGVQDFLRAVGTSSPDLAALREEIAKSGTSMTLEELQAELAAWRDEKTLSSS